MNAFANECGAEILKAWRAPEFSLPTLLLPVAFYSLFGIALAGSPTASLYLLATYGIFSVMGPALFGFGINVASERERGWLQLKRTAPVAGISYVGAKLIATLLFAAIALVIVYAAAAYGAGVAMPREVWFALFGVHLLSTLPFVFLGLTLGFVFSANGAAAAANFLFLGLAVMGGLWIPIAVFPTFLKSIAFYLPSYHLAEISLAIAGAPGEREISLNAGMVLIMTILFLGITLLAWARQKS